MTPNPITEEIRAIRHLLAAQQGNDVFRIGAELRRRQSESGRRVVRLPPRTPVSQPTIKALQRADWKWFEDERGRTPPG